MVVLCSYGVGSGAVPAIPGREGRNGRRCGRAAVGGGECKPWKGNGFVVPAGKGCGRRRVQEWKKVMK